MKRGEIRRTPTRSTGPSAEVVASVWERDCGHCAACGARCLGERGIGWSVHHRLRRGAGSTRRGWINLPGNLVLLCGHGTSFCHGRVERERAWAESAGFIVRDGVTRPADVPIEHFQHGRVLLRDDGGVSDEPPEVAA